MGKKLCKYAGQKHPDPDEEEFLPIRRVTRVCKHPRVRKFFDNFGCTGKEPFPLCCPYSGVSIKDDIAVGIITCEGKQENYFIIDRSEDQMVRNAARIIFDACKSLNRHYRPLGIRTDFGIIRRENLLSTTTFLIGDKNNLLDKIMHYELEKYSVLMLSLLKYGNEDSEGIDMLRLLEIDNELRNQ